MQWVILAAGVAIGLLGLSILVRQDTLRQLGRRVFHTSWLYGAALLRLLLGAALLAAADQLAFAAVLEVLGWLSILGGLLLVAIPVRVLRRMADRVLALPPWMGWISGSAALVLGLFLVYASLA